MITKKYVTGTHATQPLLLIQNSSVLADLWVLKSSCSGGLSSDQCSAVQHGALNACSDLVRSLQAWSDLRCRKEKGNIIPGPQGLSRLCCPQHSALGWLYWPYDSALSWVYCPLHSAIKPAMTVGILVSLLGFWASQLEFLDKFKLMEDMFWLSIWQYQIQPLPLCEGLDLLPSRYIWDCYHAYFHILFIARCPIFWSSRC